MLKAYDYVESTADRSSIQTPEQFDAEMKLAKAAVDRVIQLEAENATSCPGCGKTELAPFFTKWGVYYLRCEHCGTVFTQVGDSTLKAYLGDEGLKQFRDADSYQREASEKRSDSWQEILEWINFRSFRYLKKNRQLSVYSGGDRYRGFADMMRESDLCKDYWTGDSNAQADIALSMNHLQQTNRPKEYLSELNRRIERGGLLFLSTRLGTGFDVLMLREHAQIYPYEYVTLLSKNSLFHVLEQAGFEVLDFSTPGRMDVGYVQSKHAYIPREELFVRNLIKENDPVTLSEFQRFLQKSGMSSYAHIVAKKVENR